MMIRIVVVLLALTTSTLGVPPIVINTWNFQSSCEEAWKVLDPAGSGSGSALDAVVEGCSYAEAIQQDGSVGWGSHPDENGETTLDAMVMDGNTFNVGAVGGLRRIKTAIRVARKVLENTHHSFLVGGMATQFAVQMGFTEESLASNQSVNDFNSWKENHCQPNAWTNVSPDPSQSCGPYSPNGPEAVKPEFGTSDNHDTIGMVAMESSGRIVAGTSTNGYNHKIPGRVGDSPIPGSGAYVDSNVGGAAATGDGDVMLRFLPTFVAVEAMRSGMPPTLAAQTAVDRITAVHPDFSGAVVALAKDGTYGAACHGLDEFPFSVASEAIGGAQVVRVPCISNEVSTNE